MRACVCRYGRPQIFCCSIFFFSRRVAALERGASTTARKEDSEDLTPTETYLQCRGLSDLPQMQKNCPVAPRDRGRTMSTVISLHISLQDRKRGFARTLTNANKSNSVYKVSARSGLISMQVPFSHKEQPTFHIGFWQHVCSSLSHGSTAPFLVG